MKLAREPCQERAAASTCGKSPHGRGSTREQRRSPDPESACAPARAGRGADRRPLDQGPAVPPIDTRTASRALFASADGRVKRPAAGHRGGHSRDRNRAADRGMRPPSSRRGTTTSGPRGANDQRGSASALPDRTGKHAGPGRGPIRQPQDDSVDAEAHRCDRRGARTRRRPEHGHGSGPTCTCTTRTSSATATGRSRRSRR